MQLFRSFDPKVRPGPTEPNKKASMDVREKLNILSAAAKYDVSCTSSGSRRSAPPRGLGDACPAGICHTWSSDGRCISLLKVLLSNACKYDCAYCANRRSNDIPRATFTPKEVIDLTLEFYRRNYIEGLFLSSAVVGSPDATMERLVRVAKELRTVHRFGGGVHPPEEHSGCIRVAPPRSGAICRPFSREYRFPNWFCLRYRREPEKDCGPAAFALSAHVHARPCPRDYG